MTKKKSILFILPNLHQGGAERIVSILLNHIDLALFDPKLLLLKKEGYYLNYIPDTIEIIDLNINKIRHSLFPILNYIQREKPEIVFSGYGEVNAFLSPFIPFFKHTTFIARETNVVSQHVTRKDILFFYRFYTNFHTIIAQSNDMKEDLVNNLKINPKKIKLINNPVDFDLIDQHLENHSIPLEYQQNSHKKVVAIGNLSYRKGFDNLLQVFGNLKEEAISLFIIGDGPDKNEFLQLKNKLNLSNVHFLGKKDNPFPYLKYADLFVLSSRYEGFPNVLLEAGACGTYALANNCQGGIAEIIQEGINGQIADIENYINFSSQIKQLVNKLHDTDAICQSIKSRFHKELILKKYQALFSQ